MLAWAVVDYLLVTDQYDCAGDHAGGWETSHMMALHPETVDLAELPPKGEPLVGAGGRMAPQDATAEFGRETLEASADIVVREVQHRLAHPKRYHHNGQSLAESLWREDA
jgi:creatinine amidohydrolase